MKARVRSISARRKRGSRPTHPSAPSCDLCGLPVGESVTSIAAIVSGRRRSFSGHERCSLAVREYLLALGACWAPDRQTEAAAVPAAGCGDATRP